MFNSNNRGKNIVRSSFVGTAMFALKLVFSFLTRTVFLHVLTVDYLGISGLFSNILIVLSLAELGITSAIVYRFYEPISSGDVVQVGKLMHFFRDVYRIIALVMLCFGLCLIPFLPNLLRDSSELPNNLNLTSVYILYLLNTVSSYLFVYKQSLLGADQKNYIVSAIQVGAIIVSDVFQMISLILWQDYMIYLSIGILVSLGINYLVSLWITKMYRPVFEVTERLSKEEKLDIFRETKASMLHKIGGTVLTGTDSIVLTKFVSLTATGLYSNYSLIISNMMALLGQMLGNFTPSLGNARVNLPKEEYYILYKKLNFIGLWISSVTTVCLFVLINDFIMLWLGGEYVLDTFTVICLCLQYYFSVTRIINDSFTYAWNWFKKDQLRPIIEATLNLVISIILSRKIGIAGVFLGTCVSYIATVGWRAPYILHHFEFQKTVWEYWWIYLKFTAIVVCISTVIWVLIPSFEAFHFSYGFVGWLLWIGKAFTSFLLCNGVLILIFHKNENYIFLKYKVGCLILKLTQAGKK